MPFVIAGRRQILKKIVDTKTAMGENLRAAAFALTEARYAAGDFRFTVFDNVDQPTVKVPSLGDVSHLMPRCVSTTQDLHRRLECQAIIADTYSADTSHPGVFSGQGQHGQRSRRENPQI